MKGRPVIVAAILLSMFMSAMEATVVATAMPTAVAELGGLELYGWVGAVYMLAMTVTIPLFGKLADTAGRKPVAIWGIAIFLLGSLGSGLAPSMPLLIAARAVQGIGAGAMQPVSLTIIGDLFTPAERARIQGLFGAVWGIAGMSGPLLGGLIVNALSWRWVFYINIPFGLLSALILAVRYESKPTGEKKPIDGWGALFLSGAILLLLLGTSGTRPFLTIPGSAVCLALFIRTERNHPDPVLPLSLMTRRLISIASIQSAAIGAVLTGATLFIPLWVQAVLHGTPTQGGTSVAPMLIGWPIASAASSRILLRTGTRALVRSGAIVMALAAIGLDLSIAGSANPWFLRALTFTMGVGMGLSNTALIISVQESVAFRERGVATATTIFFRTIGGAIAVGAMGAILAWVIGGRVSEEILDDILGPDRGRSLDPRSVARVSGILAEGIHTTFHVVAGVGAVAAITSMFFPQTILERPHEARDAAPVES